MRQESFQEKRVKTFIYLAIGSVLVLFLSQVFFLHLRFHLLNAKKEVLTLKEEGCDASNCTGKWEMTPKKKLLLLGHIMRTHKLWDSRSNQQVLPISRVRGITADSWSGLRVYSVEPGVTYILEATKPKAKSAKRKKSALKRRKTSGFNIYICSFAVAMLTVTG